MTPFWNRSKNLIGRGGRRKRIKANDRHGEGMEYIEGIKPIPTDADV